MKAFSRALRSRRFPLPATVLLRLEGSALRAARRLWALLPRAVPMWRCSSSATPLPTGPIPPRLQKTFPALASRSSSIRCLPKRRRRPITCFPPRLTLRSKASLPPLRPSGRLPKSATRPWLPQVRLAPSTRFLPTWRRRAARATISPLNSMMSTTPSARPTALRLAA